MQARPVETVQVFTTARPIWHYVDVGLIEAQHGSAFASGDTRDLIADMRSYAA